MQLITCISEIILIIGITSFIEPIATIGTIITILFALIFIYLVSKPINRKLNMSLSF